MLALEFNFAIFVKFIVTKFNTLLVYGLFIIRNIMEDLTLFS